jgi:hypothetical protein
VNTTEATQDLYLSYIGLPLDPSGQRRMSTTRAAKLAGVTDRTVRNWRSNPSFAARERAMRESGVALAKQQAQSAAAVLVTGAIQTLAACLHDPTVSPAVRARIAIKVMEWCLAGDEGDSYSADDPWARLLQELQEVGQDGSVSQTTR